MTHRKSEACPFDGDKNPIGVFGTCCSYRGNAAALYMMALGLAPLAIRLYEDKLPEEALEYAEHVRAAVGSLRDFLITESTKRSGKALSLDEAEVRVPDVDWKFKPDNAFQEIEKLAAWHDKVAKMLCSIHAWY